MHPAKVNRNKHVLPAVEQSRSLPGAHDESCDESDGESCAELPGASHDESLDESHVESRGAHFGGEQCSFVLITWCIIL